MGLDISKINNAELKKLAYLKDADNNMHLEGQEFIDFKMEAAGRPDVSAEDFNQAMGLYVTNPAQTTVAEPVAEASKEVETPELEIQPAVETKKDTATTEVAKDEISKNRKKAINATCDRYLNELYEEGVSREDLIAKFDEKVGAQKDHPEYRAYRGALVDVLSLSQSYEYKTLDDINKFSKEIKATLRKYDDNDEVHKSILKIINNVIDNEIRIKALEDVEKNYYDKIVEKDKKAGKKRNNAEIMKDVRDRLYEDKKFTGDEYRTRDTKGNAYVYAYFHFINTEIMGQETDKMRSAIYTQEEQIKWRDVKSDAKDDIREDKEFDKYTRRAFNQKVGDPLSGKEKLSTKIAKNQARENNVEQHTVQTEEEILDALGKKSTVFEALISQGLITQTEDGKYDLSKLQSLLKETIGADNQLNRHVKENAEIAEKLNTLSLAAAETELSSLTEKEVIKLVKLCGFDIEKIGWDWGKAVLGAILGGVTAGLGAATGLATTPIKDGNNVNNLNVKITCNGNVSVDTSKLPAEIADAVVQNGSEILINLSKVKPGAGTLQILMALLGPVTLKSAALGAALGLLNGIDKGGEIAIASTNLGEKDYGRYIERIQDMHPEYAGVLEAIAFSFVDKEGNWDSTAYYDYLTEIAGKGSVLNWNELEGGLKALKAKAQTEDTGNKDDVVTKKVYVADKAAVEEEGYKEAVMADVPTIDGRKTSWTLITEMYPCLATKYKSLSDRIRVLKLTQAINNGNYTKERLDELLALSKKGLSAMKNIEGFDYEVYKKVLLDGVISTVKVPDELAGCKREQDQAANAEKSEGGTGTGGYAPDKVKIDDKWVQTKPGSAAVYALRVEGETEVRVFTGPGERDKAFADLKKENPGVTIEKVEVDYSKIKAEQIQE